MAETNYIRYTCEGCGSFFDSVRPKRYCTKSCNKRHIKRTGKSVSREEYLARVRENSKSKFTCEHCGIEAHRKLSSTNAKRGTGNRFCSMDCRIAASLKERQTKERQHQYLRQEIEAIRRIGRSWRHYLKARQAARSLSRICVDCSAAFQQNTHLGRPETRCELCAAAALKRARRINRLRRDARKRGINADSIDPIKVFERDKWKCHICGVKTLKRLRGTYDDRAPELEHIVPLSQGGTHTWGNVACSCRKCNGAKGATAFGQLGLAIAA